jgi:anti-anti-sigma regulatory factor
MAKNNSLIGFDPLAWMKEDGGESPVVSRSSTPSPEAGRGAPVTANEDRQPATEDSPGMVVLGETVTIEQAGALHAELGRHLGAGQVVVEAGGVERVDAAGLQLLTAFVRAAHGRGTQVEWRSPSAVLRDGARRLGLSAALRLG